MYGLGITSDAGGGIARNDARTSSSSIAVSVVITMLAVVSAAVLLSSCAGRTRRPNIVLIVIDTLRADHCSGYGYDQATTPNLDRLAEESVLFERVIAPSSWTKTSMASIMTSRNPLRHGVFRVEDALPDSHETLAESLSAGGYVTIGVNTNPWLKREFGFASGFDVYRTTAARWPYVRARDAGRIALDLLAEHGKDAPAFLYLHLMDVHAPSTPEPQFYQGAPLVMPGVGPVPDEVLDREFRKGDLDHPLVKERIIELYDAEIRSVDAAIGEFLEELGNAGWNEETITIVTSDHGEAFREHGIAGHGKNLYPEVIEVPLIFHAPGILPEGVRIGAQVRGIDLAPTILALAGLDLPEAYDGEPILPMDDEILRNRIAVSAVGGNDVIPNKDFVAVVSPEHLYIRETNSGDEELYALGPDPGARKNLGGANPAAEKLSELVRDVEAPDPERNRMDRETIDRLKALGYLQ